MGTVHMRINRYFPFLFIYFFFNGLALPFGLTWMSLLAPVFYFWMVRVRQREVMAPLLLVLLPFVLAHLLRGQVQTGPYFISLLNIILVGVFALTVSTYLQQTTDPYPLFRRLLLLNTVACVIAGILYFSPWKDVLWMQQNISSGINDFYRMKLFTYEPSYYALLFTPFFFYFLFRYWLQMPGFKGWLLLPMLALPYLLSFSIGVMAAVLFALAGVLLIHARSLIPRRRVFNLLFNTVAVLFVAGVVLFLFFRDNVLFERIGNVISGADTSGQGRTSDAFILAQKILNVSDPLWGCGPGQIKFKGADIIRSYYLYYEETKVAIPNAVAETLAIFGWVGLSLRILIQLVLFFVTRVWSNYYRLALFLFIFLYQFTGSFITNGAEYLIWVFAFSSAFPAFRMRHTAATQPAMLSRGVLT